MVAGVNDALLKKERKFSSYIRDSRRIGCIVIYEEGLPNK
jgi:hypothetical protein